MSSKIPILRYLIDKFRTNSFDDHISAYKTLDFFHIHRHASFNCNCFFSKTLNINILIIIFNNWIWFSDIDIIIFDLFLTVYIKFYLKIGSCEIHWRFNRTCRWRLSYYSHRSSRLHQMSRHNTGPRFDSSSNNWFIKKKKIKKKDKLNWY